MLLARSRVAAGQDSLRAKRVGDGGAEPAREVVVARPREADRMRARSLSQRGDRLTGGDTCNRFDEFPDMGPRKREVAVPTTMHRGDQARVDELGKVIARSGLCDTRLDGEHARRQ